MHKIVISDGEHHRRFIGTSYKWPNLDLLNCAHGSHKIKEWKSSVFIVWTRYGPFTCAALIATKKLIAQIVLSIIVLHYIKTTQDSTLRQLKPIKSWTVCLMRNEWITGIHLERSAAFTNASLYKNNNNYWNNLYPLWLCSTASRRVYSRLSGRCGSDFFLF